MFDENFFRPVWRSPLLDNSCYPAVSSSYGVSIVPMIIELFFKSLIKGKDHRQGSIWQTYLGPFVHVVFQTSCVLFTLLRLASLLGYSPPLQNLIALPLSSLSK